MLPLPELSWLEMDSNLALRIQAWHLIRLGVTQKAVAHSMGMSQSRFSQWLRDTEPIRPRLAALDGFRQFLSALGQAVTLDVTTLRHEAVDQIVAQMGASQTEATVRRTVKSRRIQHLSTKGKKLARR